MTLPPPGAKADPSTLQPRPFRKTGFSESRGGELFYRGLNGMVMAVTIALTPELRVDKPRALFDGRGYENIFQVSPGGQRLLMMPRLDNELSVTQVNVVLGFLSELRQRVK